MTKSQMDQHVESLLEEPVPTDAELSGEETPVDDGVSVHAVDQLYEELEQEDDQQPQQTDNQQPQQTDDQQQDPNHQTMVPHQALHEAREQVKMLRDQNNMLLNRMNQVLSQPIPQQQPSQQQPSQLQPPNESVEDNPLAWIEYQNQVIQQMSTANEQAAEIQRTEQYTQQLINNGHQQAMMYRQTQPDYDAAYQHVVNNRVAQMRAMSLPDAQISQQIQKELNDGILYAVNAGLNPGQMMYNMALAQGYTPQQQPQPNLQQQDQNNPVPQQQQIIPQQQPPVRTLGQNPGNPQRGALTAEAVARMSDADFEKWFEARGDDGLARLMGLQGIPE